MVDGRPICKKFKHLSQSESLLISKGVPQGSVLGPVLFTFFINTIVPLLNCQVHLYADDTILYCNADSVIIAMEQLQVNFNALQNILTDLKLVLNAQKTEFTLHNIHQDMCTKGSSKGVYH